MTLLYARFHLLCLIGFFLLPIKANVNLNLKSSKLSNLLGDHHGQQEPSSHVQVDSDKSTNNNGSSERREIPKLLHLDLSGEINCFLSGPSLKTDNDLGVEERVLRPLVRTKGPLSIFGKVHYDFSKHWYGATRILTTLRWSSNSCKANHPRQPKSSRFLPANIDLCGERGLLNAGDLAGQVNIRWKAPSTIEANAGTLLKARLDSSGGAALSTVLMPHPRFNCRLKLTNKATPLPKYCRRPLERNAPESNDDESPWWFPDIRVNAFGEAETRNEARFSSPSWMKPSSEHVAFRFVARRKLDWNALGFAARDDREPSTVVRLELTSGNMQSTTTARMEMQLEHPVRSTRMSLLQEFVVTPHKT